MTDPSSLVWAGLAGVVLGAMFFGGLWWTVRKFVASPHPAAWLLGSSLLRTGVALTGFYVVGAGRWQNLLACLAGFIAARLLMTRVLQPPQATRSRPPREARHAS